MRASEIQSIQCNWHVIMTVVAGRGRIKYMSDTHSGDNIILSAYQKMLCCWREWKTQVSHACNDSATKAHICVLVSSVKCRVSLKEHVSAIIIILNIVKILKQADPGLQFPAGSLLESAFMFVRKCKQYCWRYENGVIIFSLQFRSRTCPRRFPPPRPNRQTLTDRSLSEYPIISLDNICVKIISDERDSDN